MTLTLPGRLRPLRHPVRLAPPNRWPWAVEGGEVRPSRQGVFIDAIDGGGWVRFLRRRVPLDSQVIAAISFEALDYDGGYLRLEAEGVENGLARVSFTRSVEAGLVHGAVLLNITSSESIDVTARFVSTVARIRAVSISVAPRGD